MSEYVRSLGGWFRDWWLFDSFASVGFLFLIYTGRRDFWLDGCLKYI